jgi:hypothetical protein
MTWLTWRQHRAEVFALTLTVAVISAILVLVALPVHALFPDGAAACLNSSTAACDRAFNQMNEKLAFFDQFVESLVTVPLAIGLFLGAPLLAREYEQGTWQLAWTQGVPRMRWLAVKLGALAGATVVLAAAFTAARSWSNAPMAALIGEFDGTDFDLAGVAPSVHALFAFAAAAAAGVLLRRSLPALGTAIVVFIVVRVTVSSALRPNYQAPLTHLSPPGTSTASPDPRDWFFDFGYADAAGRRISNSRYFELVGAAHKAGVDETTYLGQQGIQAFAHYQPHDRFWAFQWTEAAIYLGLTAVLLAVVVWRVRRRSF